MISVFPYEKLLHHLLALSAALFFATSHRIHASPLIHKYSHPLMWTASSFPAFSLTHMLWPFAHRMHLLSLTYIRYSAYATYVSIWIHTCPSHTDCVTTNYCLFLLSSDLRVWCSFVADSFFFFPFVSISVWVTQRTGTTPGYRLLLLLLLLIITWCLHLKHFHPQALVYASMISMYSSCFLAYCITLFSNSFSHVLSLLVSRFGTSISLLPATR